MLVHCNSGKVCVLLNRLFLASNWFCCWLYSSSRDVRVNVMNQIQGWSLSSILWEYRLYAEPKPRFMDQQFIELFDINQINPDHRYLPDWPGISDQLYYDQFIVFVTNMTRILYLLKTLCQGFNQFSNHFVVIQIIWDILFDPLQHSIISLNHTKHTILKWLQMEN